MLNTCLNCHQYSVKKEISEDGSYMVCPKCGFHQPITRQPLFVITGASESGKSSVAAHLFMKETEYLVMDCDILWVSDVFNDHESGYRMFREVWLRLAKNISQIGKPVVLVGCAEPKQYEMCDERRYFSEAHYLTLSSDEEVLRERLEKKYKADPGYIQASLDFNEWLKSNADKTLPKMENVDVTGRSIEDIANQVDQWIMGHLKSIPQNQKQ